MEWLWIKALFSLLLVVGLIGGTLWALKKFSSFGKPAGDTRLAMNIIGTLHLQPKRAVYAIQVENKILLVGVTDHSITTLSEMPTGTLVQNEIQKEKQSANVRSFFSLFTEQLGFASKGKPSQPLRTVVPVNPIEKYDEEHIVRQTLYKSRKKSQP